MCRLEIIDAAALVGTRLLSVRHKGGANSACIFSVEGWQALPWDLVDEGW